MNVSYVVKILVQPVKWDITSERITVKTVTSLFVELIIACIKTSKKTYVVCIFTLEHSIATFYTLANCAALSFKIESLSKNIYQKFIELEKKDTWCLVNSVNSSHLVKQILIIIFQEFIQTGKWRLVLYVNIRQRSPATCHCTSNFTVKII